ncbi:PAP fibrillin [[Phormidium ambiguum] IAM M-71]|uniref:PAP fibrillin n=1 Tax=[Phormidium ambiguum] IAM M-71 TaxID=454136 RepID=A0A1U7IRE1_9CYAN|nr:PAP/fibrillin family protein [Phormidium ambiguum]OKH40028.1 PAP fibrillin [Phormidium ambiguum IAM M-71]
MKKPELINDNTTRLSLRIELLQQIEALDPQQAIFPTSNESIDQIVQQLENINPITQPLTPDYLPYLIDEWQLIYASRGTVVTRRVASTPQWGAVIKIERVWQTLVVENNDKIAAINAAILDLSWLGKWQLQANGIWAWDTPEQLAKVSFSSFSVQAKQLFGWSNWSWSELRIPVLEWLRSEAVWITSYLDEEIRVGRGATGNLFVFRRQ